MSERALELAYRYLNRRERTVSELRRHLRGRDVEEEAAAAAVQDLIDQGYLDDARFARLFVQDKRTLEQWGTHRVRRALMARGIDQELVDAALEAEPLGGEHGSELDRALGLLRQRYPLPPRNQGERERALGLLLRKGYEPDLALDALQAHVRT